MKMIRDVLGLNLFGRSRVKRKCSSWLVITIVVRMWSPTNIRDSKIATSSYLPTYKLFFVSTTVFS